MNDRNLQGLMPLYGARQDMNGAAGERFGIDVAQSLHGSAAVTNYGRYEPISEKEAGRYAEIRVYPDDGYYLKSLDIVAANGEEIRRYEEADSFGFIMPSSDITLIPVFEDRSLVCEVAPEDKLYRELREYKDGRYTGMELFVPVNTEGLKKTVPLGTKPTYTVVSADGRRLAEGRDYTLITAEEKTDAGTRHILIFDGKGCPEKDKGGYFTGQGDICKGRYAVTYMETDRPLDPNEDELTLGENRSVLLDEAYSFTPKTDCTYSFTFDAPDSLYLKTFITYGKRGTINKDGIVCHGTFTVELEGGVTYSVLTKASYNTDKLKTLDLTISEHLLHRLTVARPVNGLLAVVSSGKSVSAAYPDDTADIRVAPADGYYLKNLEVLGSDGESVGIVDCFYTYLFKMPACDVLIRADFAPVSLTQKKLPENAMYREADAYSNGRRTEGVLYIPVEISGIPDTCARETEPEYTVKSADGNELIEGIDYTLDHQSENTESGILHTLTFEGTGTVYKGVQTVTYTETDAAPINELVLGVNYADVKCVNIFIPEESGKYRLTFNDTDSVLSELSVTNASGEIEVEHSGRYALTFELAAGDCYLFSFGEDHPSYADGSIDLTLEKLMPYRINVLDAPNGSVEADCFEDEISADGMVTAGNMAALWIYPDDGCDLVYIEVLKADGTPVEIVETPDRKACHFRMPDSDVTVRTVFEKIPDTTEEETLTPEPEIADIKQDYSVACTKVVDLGYSNYATGNDVFKVDFELTHHKSGSYRGALLEFEFDSPIAKFMYGADIGNSTVFIPPDDPGKVVVNFAIETPEGETAPIRSSYLVISPANAVKDLECLSARIIGVTEA